MHSSKPAHRCHTFHVNITILSSHANQSKFKFEDSDGNHSCFSNAFKTLKKKPKRKYEDMESEIDALKATVEKMQAQMLNMHHELQMLKAGNCDEFEELLGNVMNEISEQPSDPILLVSPSVPTANRSTGG